ncbi:MAG: 5'/3'-nucleotidase SurE [Verrucomicrobia bacterium]|nr:5'/3'-nucleotidase SurE [Verrucomicrobiota bacterium]
MNLLLTNDDGIDCLFLHALARTLRADGHRLYVAAPRSEQSWIGCAKSRRRPVAASVVDKDLDCPTWSIDGTPSDCVSIALAHLLPRDVTIDAVVSGINVGRNASLGFILASGTIAGAWEGAVHGLPAIAYSLDLTAEAFESFHRAPHAPSAELQASLREAAIHAARLTPGLVAATEACRFIVHNVNFPHPCRADSAVRRTVPARVVVPGLFTPAADDGTHRFIFKLGEDVSPAGPLTDRAALDAGNISHTVLDYTALGAFGPA